MGPSFTEKLRTEGGRAELTVLGNWKRAEILKSLEEAAAWLPAEPSHRLLQDRLVIWAA